MNVGQFARRTRRRDGVMGNSLPIILGNLDHHRCSPVPSPRRSCPRDPGCCLVTTSSASPRGAGRLPASPWLYQARAGRRLVAAIIGAILILLRLPVSSPAARISVSYRCCRRPIPLFATMLRASLLLVSNGAARRGLGRAGPSMAAPQRGVSLIFTEVAGIANAGGVPAAAQPSEVRPISGTRGRGCDRRGDAVPDLVVNAG